MRLATKVIVCTALTLALLTALIRTFLPLRDEPRAFSGYTLIAPRQSTRTYLVDMQGKVVRMWESDYTAGQGAYLLENGHLLRAGKLPSEEQLFVGAGAGGRVQEFTWEGELIWDFKFHDQKRLPHHDIARMPNGNVLLIVWGIKTAEETIAAGCRPESVDGPRLADSVIEIKPTGKTTGAVVWEWHAWDHLIQDQDSAKANYGAVAAHPELIDINFGQHPFLPVSSRPAQSPEQEARDKNTLNALRSIGYLGSPAASGNQGVIPEWTHVNAVAYNAEFDQIMLTVLAFNEFWIIDHGTTTAEAAGHTGGRGGKGGDLLYRWGNPRAYRAGTEADRRLFAQHDAHWIPPGRPGAGHVLVFNNGGGRPGGSYSSVDEVILPVDARGRYRREPGTAYGPKGPVWRYTTPGKTDFFAWLMSGAQRLPNGDTLICDSVSGAIFEVTPKDEIVWKYTCPDTARSRPGEFGDSPRYHEILAPFLRDLLKLSPEQKKDLDRFQQEIDAQLDKTLTADQKPRFRMSDGFALPGQIMSLSTQIALKATDQQKTKLTRLQKEVDDQLDQILTADQKVHLQKMKDDFLRGGRLRAGPGRTAGPPGLGPGGPGGLPGAAGARGKNAVFRAYRYGTDYAGLAGKVLKPDQTVEERESVRSGNRPRAAIRD